MGILLTIAGIIIVLYTLSSIIALWLAVQVMEATDNGQDIPEGLEEVPPRQIELMSNYAKGWRRHVWAASIVALFTTLLAMLANSPLAFWALGTSMLLEVTLFMTYPDIKGLLAKADFQERLVEAIQSIALLAAFSLLLWYNLRIGHIIK